MRTLAIDLNDAGLVVANDGTVLAVEPGYARVEEGRITTGEPARASARLYPQRTGNRYWSQLSLDPATAGVSGVGSAAELAFAQLRTLWERFGGDDADVVLVVPGHYERNQLGVLLGLAQECGMPVRALVDAAVAASMRPYPGKQLLYVDAGLHRVSVTPVEQGEEAVTGTERSLASIGLANLTDSLAAWCAERFVRATRFDPFHRAATEQQLYDVLPVWLRLLEDKDSADFVLPRGNDEVRISVERDQMRAVFAGFNRALVQLIAEVRQSDVGVVVQLSERLARLPGLASELGRLDDARIIHFETGHTAFGALAGINGHETGDSVKLLKHLPWREQPVDSEEDSGEVVETASAPDLRDAAAPTHVVYQGVAFRIAGDGLLIGRDGVEGRRTLVVAGTHSGLSRSHCELVSRDGELRLRDLSRYGTFLNERRIDGEARLKLQDVIRVGTPGAEIEVIRVENGHGTP